MNEEKILKYIKDVIEIDEDTIRFLKDIPESKTYKEVEKSIKAYKGLLDLYKKEKEQNSIIKEKLKELNIPMETLIGEFNRLEDLEDDRERLKALLKEEKEKNKELQNYMKEFLIPKSTINILYFSKDKIRDRIEELENSKEDYTFNKLTSEDIRRTLITELKQIIGEE